MLSTLVATSDGYVTWPVFVQRVSMEYCLENLKRPVGYIEGSGGGERVSYVRAPCEKKTYGTIIL